MADIALSAGFGSVRSFNAAFLGTYGRSPSQLRKLRSCGSGEGEILLRLAYRPPFDWKGLLGFLVPRATPGVELVEGAAYRRTVALGGKFGVIDVRQAKGRQHHLELRVSFPDPVGLFHIAERVRRLFDLDADPSEICRHLRRDRLLAPLVKSSPGARVPGAWDGFELAVRAILGQQVSVRGATTLAGRVVREFGRSLVEPVGGLTHLFPIARRIARADLTRIGMPGSRAAAITGLARAVVSGKVDFQAAPDEGIRQLTGLKGIGDWTAQYVAMRAFRDPDGFPASDLALLRSLGDGSETIAVKKLLERAEPWRPWRAYAAMHLWRRYGGLIETKRARERVASATA
jgi:AraC family transcriptional regulator of adaptative response / DNA-3-methyladenine glycosylase II